MQAVEHEEIHATAANDHQATAEIPGDLVLEAERGDRGQTRVTAKLHGDPLYMDAFDPSKASARKRFCQELSKKIPSVNMDEIDAQLMELADYAPARTKATENATREPEALLAEMPAEICAEASAMLKNPLLIQQVVDDIAVMGVAGEKELTGTCYLTGVSRLLDRPLSARIKGPSSSGKSIIIEETAQLFPREATIIATQMTPQALFHMQHGALVHRFVVAGERSRIEAGEQAEATRALREMISAGKLSKLMPVKVDGGKIESVLIEQPGPIAFIESTTLSRIFDEDANRCITMHTDEQSSQTRRIIQSIAKARAGNTYECVKQQIIQKHHALQRMLRSIPVRVPYAERLAELISDDRVEARRAFSHMMSLIEAVVLLHQKMRTADSNGYLIATREDYQIARHLLLKPMSLLLGGGLSDPARRFLTRLETRPPGNFTTTEICKTEPCKSSVHGWLREVREEGYVEVVEPGRGQKPAIWRLTDKKPENGYTVLPACETVFEK